MRRFSFAQTFNLFIELSKKEYTVRYKQAILGFGWAVVRPMLFVAAFYFIFGKVAGLQPDANLNYFTMVYLGMMPWFLFINIVTDGSNSMLSNASMITKVYFPRILLPLSVILVSFVDFVLMFSILLIFKEFFDVELSLILLFVPILILLIMIPAVAISLILAPLAALYRDIKFVVPFLAQLGVYITPIGFTSTIMKDQIGILYYLNPMVLPIEGFRWIFSGVTTTHTIGIIITLIVDILLLGIAVIVFNANQDKIVDRI